MDVFEITKKKGITDKLMLISLTEKKTDIYLEILKS